MVTGYSSRPSKTRQRPFLTRLNVNNFHLGACGIGLGIFLTSISYAPFLDDHYTAIKWIVVYWISVFALVSLFFSKNLPTLDFGTRSYRFFRWTCTFLFAFTVLSHLQNPHASYLWYLLDSCTFFGLIIASFFFYEKNGPVLLSCLELSMVIATVAVTGYGLLQMTGIEPILNITHSSIPSSFFGFQNMTAEFMGFSILIQFHSIFRETKGILAKSLLLSLSIFYFLNLHCRAATLALFFCFLHYFLIKKTEKIIYTWIIAGIMLTSTASFLSFPSLYPEIAIIKQTNSQLRVIRWMNTLQMIFEHPWGTGPMSYEFSYLPYRSKWKDDFEVSENHLARSPHNTYLGLAAENGIGFAIVLLITFGYLFTKLSQTYNKNKNPEALLILSVFIFTAIDALFAFPTENAFPFLMMAISTGIGLSLITDHINQSPLRNLYNFKIRSIILILIVIISYLGGSYMNSKYVEKNSSTDIEALKFACHSFPTNWRPCIQWAELNISLHHFDSAEQTLSAILGRSPHNFIAIRLLSHILFTQDRFEEGCRWIKQYDEYFGKRSSLHPIRQELCL